MEVTFCLKGYNKGDIDLSLGITNSISKSFTSVYFRIPSFFLLLGGDFIIVFL
jgi:hypothetical protein